MLRHGRVAQYPEPIKDEDGRSILYSVSPEDAAALLLAVVKRQDFFIAIMRESSSSESVYSGPLRLAEKDADEIALCVRELKP